MKNNNSYTAHFVPVSYTVINIIKIKELAILPDVGQQIDL
jgi:hypothetical protein